MRQADPNRLTLTRRLFVRVAITASGLLLIGTLGGFRLTAYADSPALSDFGQDAVEPVMTESRAPTRALFVTLYPDGRQHMEMRVVRGDAVAGFAAEHPAWRIDPGLMWFLDMPVYIRDLSTGAGVQVGPTNSA